MIEVVFQNEKASVSLRTEAFIVTGPLDGMPAFWYEFMPTPYLCSFPNGEYTVRFPVGQNSFSILGDVTLDDGLILIREI